MRPSKVGCVTLPCVIAIHERSILIERSPKAGSKKQPRKKTMRDTKSAYNH